MLSMCKAWRTHYVPAPLVLASVIILAAGSALAQSPGSAAKPNSTIPEKQHMGPVDPPPTNTNGVITPRDDADPDMTKKPPPQNTNETPVIPPKGMPDGAAGAEPK